MFEFVKFAGFGVENVHHCIEIVHQYPSGVTGTFRVCRGGIHFLFYFFVDTVGDSLYMRVGIALANDEEICRRIAEFSEVELHDFLAFFVANALYNEVVELFNLRVLGPTAGNRDQILLIYDFK